MVTGLPGRSPICDSRYYTCLHNRALALARYFHCRAGEGGGWGRGREGPGRRRETTVFAVRSRTGLRDYGGNLEIYRCIYIYSYFVCIFAPLPLPDPLAHAALLLPIFAATPSSPSAYVSVRRDMHRTEWCQCALSLYISTPYACRTWHALAVSRAITDRKSSAKLLVRKADARRYRREADTVPYGAVRPPGSRLHHATDDFPLLGGEKFRSLPLVLNSPA